MAEPLLVSPVESDGDLRRFVRLPYRLYRGDPLWVPQLLSQETRQFRPADNPAFETCRARLFLASRGGTTVGRIAAIVSDGFMERWGRTCGRFGWFECGEDPEAASALLRAAEEWARGEGMTEMSGPLGFSDNDPTGLLVEGYGELPTIAGSYNPPRYCGYVESAGYSKEVDYVEYLITVPAEMPERIMRVADLTRRRTGIRVFTEKSRSVLARRWGHSLFDVLNESYRDLYGTSLLSRRQIDYYIDTYLGHVDPGFIILAADGDRLVGFIIAMPNLSRAFQKARGRLLPLGFLHILRAMRRSRVLDFYLAGILPEYRNRGVDVLMSVEMGRNAIRRGMTHAESNHELEDNTLIQSMWKLYDRRLHRRARVYNRKLV